ncbi:MAG: hypothetical protein BCS36_01730 [Desulfovibrio sp. MES5]|uniref:restriction endonuclease subunit S n=1 Tax=Desulfovibrionaceae TaxID=194924 RepID=UPI000B9D394D|nr:MULTISPECIES: restriction endonuclease subunit S [Desulfovibrionaceae]OXS28072.1 MAG: hypothetical protein BCS36_01730 [Desulfovibrio sp. MES5]
MKGYGEYKCTDEFWLPQIPAHWQFQKVKRLFSERIEKGHPDKPLLAATQNKGVVLKKDYGSRTVEATKDLHLLKLVRQGDFVISLRSFQGGIEYSHADGIISPAYTVMISSSKMVPGYFRYFAKIPCFLDLLKVCVTGIREGQNVDYKKLREHSIPIPPREEQDQIVRYLDAKVGKINQLIRIKQQQIALLKEKKQAIINQAVTKGLDPNAPMKDSGIAWIGQIPEGWEVLKIKQVSKILRGKFNHRPRNDERLYGGKFPFIQTGDVAQSGKYIESYKQTLNSLGFAVSKEFPIGTLVMTIAANIGDVSILKFNACFPDSIVGFIPRCASIEYLYFLFLAMKPELLKEAPVNTQGNLNVERIGQMLIPLPEESIQEAIVQKLNILDSLYQKKITIIGEEIATLTEYRTRLISDVVTGKVDVRHINIPDSLTIDIEEDFTTEEAVDGDDADTLECEA